MSFGPLCNWPNFGATPARSIVSLEDGGYFELAREGAAAMSEFYLGIDVGTGGCRVGIYDDAGKPLAFKDSPLTSYYPKSGWVEQNVDDWWQALVS